MANTRQPGWVLDLDGVVWRGARTIPGSPEAVALLRESGHQVIFVTNSALRTPRQVAENLADHGIPRAESEVVTAAMAAAELVAPGEKVVCCGAEGLRHSLERRGATIVTGESADAVVVGIHPGFDYALLTVAMRAVRGGARLIATNDDPTYPDADGLLPGNGALVAAVERASGATAVVAGKPHEAMCGLVRHRVGSTAIVVGDRPETDGRLAEALGYDFALVLSGVLSADDLPVEPLPAIVADDLLTAVRTRL